MLSKLDVLSMTMFCAAVMSMSLVLSFYLAELKSDMAHAFAWLVSIITSFFILYSIRRQRRSFRG